MRKDYFISLSTWYDKSHSSSQYLTIHQHILMSVHQLYLLVHHCLYIIACTNRVSIQSSKLKWCCWCICENQFLIFPNIQYFNPECHLGAYHWVNLLKNCCYWWSSLFSKLFRYFCDNFSNVNLYLLRGRANHIFRELYGQLGKTIPLNLFSIPFLCVTVQWHNQCKMKDFLVKDVVFIERKWIGQHLSEMVKRLCKLGIDLVMTAKT